MKCKLVKEEFELEHADQVTPLSLSLASNVWASASSGILLVAEVARSRALDWIRVNKRHNSWRPNEAVAYEEVGDLGQLHERR